MKNQFKLPDTKKKLLNLQITDVMTNKDKSKNYQLKSDNQKKNYMVTPMN